MSIPAETLTRLVRHHLPAADDEPIFEPIHTGKFNTSYWVGLNGHQLVLRIAPPRDAVFVFYERDMMRQEPELHERLLSSTGVPVAKILVHDRSGELIDRDFLLMERLPGRSWAEMDWVSEDRVLRQVGEHMAEVHQLHDDHHGYLGAHQPMEPQARWVDAFAVMWGKMIDDIVGVGYYDSDESTLMRRLLDSKLKLFDRPVTASLLHMDVWRQNILVDSEGNVTGLVDWDRALWGDPEIEYAVLDYCGISEPAFWEGYGQPRDDSPEARIRQLFYLLYELQKYIVIRHGRNHDPVSARRYKHQVVEIVNRALL
ncbi:MAG: phosphotransferase [bacterium]|nr:phosphotransferase [bacterium]